MELTAIALQGMEQAGRRLETSAARIARLGTADYGGDTVDLSREAVETLAARTDFAANARVAGTGAEMEKKLVDLLA
jgi:flagellar hook protein FlgE